MKTLLRLLPMPGLVFLCLLALRYGLRRRVLKRSEAKASPNGIVSAERVTLGGVEQAILIQGEDVTRPVFLILHGGPGMPFPGVAAQVVVGPVRRVLSFRGYPSARKGIFSGLVTILSPGLPALLSPFLTSPDYTLDDLVRLFPGLKTSTEALLEDIALLDLSASAPRVEVPVYFFHGAHDQGAQLPILQRYVEGLDAPRGKLLQLLDGSAHIFSLEDSRRVEHFLAETLPGLANPRRQAP